MKYILIAFAPYEGGQKHRFDSLTEVYNWIKDPNNGLSYDHDFRNLTLVEVVEELDVSQLMKRTPRFAINFGICTGVAYERKHLDCLLFDTPEEREKVGDQLRTLGYYTVYEEE